MPTIITPFNVLYGYGSATALNHWPDEKIVAVPGGSAQVIHNARQRRKKPTDLRSNPTPLPTQSRSFVRPALSKKMVRPPNDQGIFTITGESGSGLYAWPTVPAFPSNMYVNKLRNRIKDIQGVNIAEDVFEFRQTANLFGGIVSEVARGYQAYRALRRGDLAAAQKLSRKPLTKESIAKAHLAASWGVVPLIPTIQEGISGLNKELMNDARYWKQFRVSARFEESKPQYPGGNSTTPLEMAYSVWKEERANVWVKFRPGGVRQVQFGNALELGWNLLTLSCIADWFIPIGESLSALDAMSGVEKVIGTVSTKTHVYRSVQRAEQHWFDHGWENAWFPVKKAESCIDTYGRIVLSSLPPATLPRWDPSESWRKLSLATAVLVGLRGGKRTKPGSDPLKPISGPDVRRLARDAAKRRSDTLNGRRTHAPHDPWGANPL